MFLACDYTESTGQGSAGAPRAWKGIVADIFLIRSILVAVVAAVTAYLRPFGLSTEFSALLGVGVAGAIILFELRLSRASLKRLIGAAIGSILGILGAYLISLIIRGTGFNPRTGAFLSVATLLVMFYVGLVVGAEKGDLLNLAALGGLFGGERTRRSAKLLDTSAIIDARIADVVEAGFLEGSLLIPQFVLRELQLIADSSDSSKRNRGRRGLDVVQRLQKLPRADLIIIDDDIPQLREVDQKIIEIAKRYECKIVTNDFNLNKLAQVQRLEVLNVNDLANALKPAVLPGESMRVFILKEGKEFNQGVAYLDDGTMVVVDHARKHISKTVNVVVTSVLQTAAGKMIFGRCDERAAEGKDGEAEAMPSRGPRPASSSAAN